VTCGGRARARRQLVWCDHLAHCSNAIASVFFPVAFHNHTMATKRQKNRYGETRSSRVRFAFAFAAAARVTPIPIPVSPGASKQIDQPALGPALVRVLVMNNVPSHRFPPPLPQSAAPPGPRPQCNVVVVVVTAAGERKFRRYCCCCFPRSPVVASCFLRRCLYCDRPRIRRRHHDLLR
jgi:hypothetical protein